MFITNIIICKISCKFNKYVLKVLLIIELIEVQNLPFRKFYMFYLSNGITFLGFKLSIRLDILIIQKNSSDLTNDP